MDLHAKESKKKWGRGGREKSRWEEIKKTLFAFVKGLGFGRGDKNK